MKKLLEDTPALETIVHAVLFRVYSEEASVEQVLEDLDESIWQDIAVALGEVTDNKIIGYIARKELGDVHVMEIDLDDKMINELLELTSKKENWNQLGYEEGFIDYYMYILYRIENGKIIEILP